MQGLEPGGGQNNEWEKWNVKIQVASVEGLQAAFT